MRRLSPADRPSRPTWRFYALFIAVIRGECSYTRVLKELASRSIIVVHDEENRRIVFKTPLEDAVSVAGYLSVVSSTATVELKYGDRLPRGIPSDKCLRRTGYLVAGRGRRVLAYRLLEDSTIFVEIKPGHILAKYGRCIHAPILSPSELPPSIFTFGLRELTPKLVEKAKLRFMNARDEILRCIPA